MKKAISLLLIIVLLFGSLCTTAFAQSSTKVVKIYAGDGYTIGLCDDGSIKFAGSYDGRWNLRDVAKWNNIEALFMADSLAIGRKLDGSYISNAGPIAIPGKLVAMETGVVGEYVFLMADGRLYHTPEDDPYDIVLQYDGRDRLGLEYPLWSDLKGIEIGSDSAFGLKKDGTIITCPGMYRSGDRFRLIESWTDISAISMGFGYVPVALKSNGTVVTVPNPYGVIQDTSKWRSVKEIYTESNITIGLCENGRVYATGGEYEAAEYISQIEKWTDIVDIALGQDHVVGLKSDGTLVAVGNNDAGQCDVGSWSSKTTTLTVTPKPTPTLEPKPKFKEKLESTQKPKITTNPSSVTVKAGEKATFTVGASGADLNYQWQYRTSSSGSWSNTSLGGNKTSKLTIIDTIGKNGYQYRCKVTNSTGTVYSSAATLTVRASSKPTIISNPKSVTVDTDSNRKFVSFTVTATGEENLTYQWQYRTSNSGSWLNSSKDFFDTSDTLVVYDYNTKNGYQYRCKVSNSAGTVYSDAATLMIRSTPSVKRLSGSWKEQEAIHNGVSSPFYLTNAVKNCKDLTMTLQIPNYTGYPFGNWYLYVKDLDNNWEHIADFKIEKEQGNGYAKTYNFHFTRPQSFKALAICIRDNGNEFHISYNIDFYV